MAEWLRSGLQSRVHRFDSGRRLALRPTGSEPAPARSAPARVAQASEPTRLATTRSVGVGSAVLYAQPGNRRSRTAHHRWRSRGARPLVARPPPAGHRARERAGRRHGVRARRGHPRARGDAAGVPAGMGPRRRRRGDRPAGVRRPERPSAARRPVLPGVAAHRARDLQPRAAPVLVAGRPGAPRWTDADRGDGRAQHALGPRRGPRRAPAGGPLLMVAAALTMVATAWALPVEIPYEVWNCWAAASLHAPAVPRLGGRDGPLPGAPGAGGGRQLRRAVPPHLRGAHARRGGGGRRRPHAVAASLRPCPDGSHGGASGAGSPRRRSSASVLERTARRASRASPPATACGCPSSRRTAIRNSGAGPRATPWPRPSAFHRCGWRARGGRRTGSRSSAGPLAGRRGLGVPRARRARALLRPRLATPATRPRRRHSPRPGALRRPGSHGGDHPRRTARVRRRAVRPHLDGLRGDVGAPWLVLGWAAVELVRPVPRRLMARPGTSLAAAMAVVAAAGVAASARRAAAPQRLPPKIQDYRLIREAMERVGDATAGDRAGFVEVARRTWRPSCPPPSCTPCAAEARGWSSPRASPPTSGHTTPGPARGGRRRPRRRGRVRPASRRSRPARRRRLRGVPVAPTAVRRRRGVGHRPLRRGPPETDAQPVAERPPGAARSRGGAAAAACCATSAGAPKRSRRPPKAMLHAANHAQPSARPARTSLSQWASSRTRLAAIAAAIPAAPGEAGARAAAALPAEDERGGREERRGVRRVAARERRPERGRDRGRAWAARGRPGRLTVVVSAALPPTTTTRNGMTHRFRDRAVSTTPSSTASATTAPGDPGR